MNRKGISPINATLLMIAIALVISALATVWWIGIIGSQPRYTSTMNIREIHPMPNSESKYLLMLSNNTLKIAWISESVVEKIVLNKDIQVTYYHDNIGKLWIVDVEK